MEKTGVLYVPLHVVLPQQLEQSLDGLDVHAECAHVCEVQQRAALPARVQLAHLRRSAAGVTHGHWIHTAVACWLHQVTGVENNSEGGACNSSRCLNKWVRLAQLWALPPALLRYSR